MPPTGAQAAATMSAADYAVLVVYLAATFAIGAWMCRGQSTLGQYFLADRKTHWILACVSIIATDISAISYMGVPAWVFRKDLKYNTAVILAPAVMMLVIWLFVPLYHRLSVFTVYEYLERRFNPFVRTAAAVLFMFQRGVLLAGAIYIPSIALSTFTGVPATACILFIGAGTTIYTLVGGMKAVIWTDFMQFFVMVGGLVLMIVMLLSAMEWQIAGIWREAGSIVSAETHTPHTTMVDPRLDFKVEATLWSLVFYYFVYVSGVYGTDQIIVQRYFTMGSMREIAKSILGAALVLMLMVFALSYLGILLVVYYNQHPELAATLANVDTVLPHYVVNVLPPGLRGVIFAALLAATMSTVSSGLNSLSTVGMMDLYRRYRPKAADDERHCLRLAKFFTLLAGVVLTGLAIWLQTFTTTILETINNLASKFIGPMSAIFFLGVLTRRANVPGVLAGAAAGLATSFLCDLPSIADRVNWLWTAPLACCVTFVVGYVVSLATKPMNTAPPGTTLLHIKSVGTAPLGTGPLATPPEAV